jgi:hypothetical protein
MNDSTDSVFRHIPNPYIVGNPIRDPCMFFGREDEFAYIRKKFSAEKEGGIVVLCGARRSGKTSILFQVSGGRLGESFLPVLTDMQSMTIRNDQDFLTKLAQEIVTTIDHPKIDLQAIEPKWDDNPFTAFENLIKKINLNVEGKKLILMFDEYELFETHIDSGIISTNILHLLANLIEHRRVFVVLTGSDNLEARNKPYWSVFLSKALHRRISFLSHGDTLRLVLQPVEKSVHYGEGIPDDIFKMTAGQPFYTQVLCQSLVDHLNDNHQVDVEAEDLQQVVDEIIENPLPQMIFSWNALSDLEKLSLSIIAELCRERSQPATAKEIMRFTEQEKIGYRLDANELNKCLENLFHHDVLTKEGPEDAYRFKMDLWRLWVTRMHSVWQVIDEMERSEAGRPGKGIIPKDLAEHRRRDVIVAAVIALLIVTPIGIWLLTRDGGSASSEASDSAALYVDTNPSRANIFVDDELIGLSPVEGAEVPVESRVLTIELAGYRTVRDTLVLEKDKIKELRFDLTELAGNLEILSEPPGAVVYVNGESTHLNTPAVVRQLSANMLHRIELRLQGYQTGVLEGVHACEDSTIKVSHSFLKMTGALSVVSQPAEAEVYLDGEFVGSTPCILERVPYGRHGLELSKAGYFTYVQDIDVSKPNEKIEAVLGLLPPGKIVFNIQPYAALSINGDLVREDVTYHEVQLAPGRYTVLLEHPRFGTYTEEVQLESNESVTVQHKFSD